MNQYKENRINEWIKLGNRDLEAAEILLDYELQVYDILCFHCQQSAEKYLKALLVFFDIEAPRTHIIEQLITLLETKISDMSPIENAVELSDYAVRYRYPDHYEVDNVEDAIKVLELARTVKTFVLQKMLKAES